MSGCRPGISKDFHSLLTDFLGTSELSYNAYCKFWRDHNMSMIHYGEKEPLPRRLLFEEMSDHILSLLHAQRITKMYLFVVYTLFSLHQTQLLTPRVPIMVDARTWNIMVEFHRGSCTEPNMTDARHAFSIMVKQRAFSFGARDKTAIRYPIAIAPLPSADKEPIKNQRYIPKIPDGLWESVHHGSLLEGYRDTGIPLSELQNAYADYEDALGEVDPSGTVDELSHYNPEFPQDLKNELQRYWVAFDERAQLVANRLADDIGNPEKYRKQINSLLAKKDPTRKSTDRPEAPTTRKKTKIATQDPIAAKTLSDAVQDSLRRSEESAEGVNTTHSFHMPSLSTNASRPGSRSSTIAPTASQSRASPVPGQQSAVQTTALVAADELSDLFSDSDSDKDIAGDT